MASKQIWCDDCGTAKKLHEMPSVVLTIARTPPSSLGDPGEPGEYARYIRGTLKQTSEELRTIRISSMDQWGNLTLREQSTMENHVCDWCNVALLPGQTVWCVTYWLEIHPDPELWEADFLEGLSR